MKYFLYARKSTDVEDKQVLSIEAQLAELRGIVKRDDLEVVEEFIEKKSAKKPGRAVFEEMLRLIDKGEAQGIICWKVDRLSRNPVDSGRISWLLQQNIIQEVITHDRVYLPQDNVLIMSIEFGMANQYIRDLSQNTRRGLIAKARRGEFPTIAPVGYLNDVRNKTIVVDRKKAKIIKEAFELYSQGEPRLEDIADFLYARSVRTTYGNKFHRDRVKFVLSNPFYYGHFYYSREIYEGKHTPIISKKLFDKVQNVLLERSRPAKPRNNPQAFCGLLRCATCGMMITAENKIKRQKNGNIHRYTYYRCTKKSKTISCNEECVREEELTEQVNAILNGSSMPSRWAEEFERLIKEDEKKAEQESSILIEDLRNKISVINEKIQRLLDVYLAQDIDRETYLKERSKLFSDKKSFEEKIWNLERNAKAWLEPMQEWLNVASGLAEAAQSNDLPSKKSLIPKIFGSNPTLHDRRIQDCVSPPYAALRAARQKFSENETSFIRVLPAGIEPTSKP